MATQGSPRSLTPEPVEQQSSVHETSSAAQDVSSLVATPEEKKSKRSFFPVRKMFQKKPNDESSKPKWPEPTIGQGLRAIVKSSWLNVLVVFIPLGIASKFVWSPTVTFILNFIAIIPLAKLLGFATEDLALRTGEIIGGFLNASFGNAVELIISVISLRENLIVVVQSSMLGSIISNLLLVLGMSFFYGGCYHKEQSFNLTMVQTSASLLFISTAALVLPAAFYASSYQDSTTAQITSNILVLSRATAVILLVVYLAYMFFQMKTHKSFFLKEMAAARSYSFLIRNPDVENNENNGEEEQENPAMPAWMAVVLLLVITALVAVSSDFLVSAIESVVDQWHITQTFVGLILLPIVGNAAEHVTAVTMAGKNKMDLTIGVAVGSSTQIAMFVTPLLVIIGWGLQLEMTLYFNIYETAVMFISVVLVNYLIMDGKSNWLEGFMLTCMYLIIAISFYYYPDAASGHLVGDAPSAPSASPSATP